MLFDDPANKVLLDLTLLMVQLWISEYIEHDNFILSSVVELVEVLICSQKFWAAFKMLPITAKLLGLSKKPNVTAFVKSKIINIVTSLSKTTHTMPK